MFPYWTVQADISILICQHTVTPSVYVVVEVTVEKLCFYLLARPSFCPVFSCPISHFHVIDTQACTCMRCEFERVLIGLLHGAV